MPVNKHNILSTKPLAEEQVQHALRHGCVISGKSFIAIRPVITAGIKARCADIFRTGGLIVFTSPNAVRIVADMLRGVQQTGGIHVFCIQGATRDAVASLLPQAEIAGTAAHSTALAEGILQTGAVSVVFFCGNIRRDELPKILRGQGVNVEEIIVYETLETPVRLTSVYDGILFYSPSSVMSFFSANTLPAHTVCFAIGHTTANALRQLTANKVVISPEPAVDTLLQTVILYFDNINSQE